MRAAHETLMELLTSRSQLETSRTWLKDLERCGWLSHIALVLKGAVDTATYIHEKESCVLVHCSDGWDRTAQVAALTQILCDGECRTIRGLEMLIEKEWVAYGHQFVSRVQNFHWERPEFRPDQFSPVFLQFIESIWQVSIQFPESFEFNQLFLLTIMEQLVNGQSGTFLTNFEKDRAQLRQHTLSAWSIINQELPKFLNPFYNPDTRYQREPILPEYHVGKLKIWDAYYCREHLICQPGDSLQAMTEEILRLRQETCCLREELDFLRAGTAPDVKPAGVFFCGANAPG